MSSDDWTTEGSDPPQSLPTASPETPLQGETPTTETATAEPFLLDPNKRPILRGDLTPLHFSVNGCLLLFLLPFIAIGVVMPIWGLTSWLTQTTVWLAPVPVQAEVVGTHTSNGGEDSDTYYVTYRYQAGGQSFERDASVSNSDQNSAAQQHQIKIAYSSAFPSQSRAYAEQTVPLIAVLFFCAFWDGILLIGLGACLRGWRRNQRLSSEGRLREGTVTGCTSQLDSDNDLMVTVVYRFCDPEGRQRDGQDTRMRNDLKGEPLPLAGTPVAVLYADSSCYLVL